ncbi:serine hydrolase [Aurantimonas coralicida]|uniref:serine hydrolase n=1 Tax=Aurantimonas coralicida TaxID=182270 RepID=UPI001E5F0E61|nr:serine hydrolase [Aurantimonas coralicida]MCD1644554.1 serine hydrolase [Aurantimonas coralicida]
MIRPVRSFTNLALPAFALSLFMGALAAPAMAQEAASPSASNLLPAPVMPVPPLLDRQQVDRAVDRLDAVVEGVMETTGVPGVAVAVVYRDEVLFAKGFGLREVGQPETVDADTVFLLASLSKPIALTLVAGLVGDGLLEWDQPVRGYDPSFALSDPYVSDHATFADLMSHRSGLATGAGDLLEDLGFDRETILTRIDQQPLDPFRSTYHYSNLGYTAGAVAAAKAAGQPFEALATERLFQPLGMTRTSYRNADYAGHANRARIHVRAGAPDEGRWEARYERVADAEAPAGGASASVSDMARFLRLQLGKGRFKGTPLIDESALATTHQPHMPNRLPADPAIRAGFYGLGWNVGTDDQGRVTLGHSGAFNLGTATAISLLPGEELGIVVLTNGEPIGVPEAICASFMDIVQNGEQTVDWLGFIGGIFAAQRAAELEAAEVPPAPANATAPRDLETYAGRYANSYYGPLRVEAEEGALSMILGPAQAPTRFALTAYDGDVFTFETIGENATGPSLARFRTGDDGRVADVTLDYYDRAGLGIFVRD